MTNEVCQRLVEYIRYKGISVREFERRVGVSNGFVKGVTASIGADKLQRICGIFPDLNRDWLLYGEGEMLLPAATLQQHNVHGDNNAAHTITTSGDTATDKLLNIVTQSQHLATTAQEQTTKAQQHIDRLLAIIERLSDGQKMQMP